MIHTFTVRDLKGHITTLSVSASTRALAATWIDKSPLTIVSTIKR